jgi:hypothetical protein
MATVALMTGSNASAQAQLAPLPAGGGFAPTFQTMSSNLAVASSGFNNLISVLCWIGGAGLGVTALFKLKQHVDSGGQTAMKDGLIRLGAAGALLAFPFIAAAMQGSISDGNLAKVAATPLIMDSTVAFQ